MSEDLQKGFLLHLQWPSQLLRRPMRLYAPPANDDLRGDIQYPLWEVSVSRSDGLRKVGANRHWAVPQNSNGREMYGTTSITVPFV